MRNYPRPHRAETRSERKLRLEAKRSAEYNRTRAEALQERIARTLKALDDGCTREQATQILRGEA